MEDTGIGELKSSTLCIPQTDMTADQYKENWETFQSEQKTPVKKPNGGQNGETVRFGPELPDLDAISKISPVRFQNRPGAGRIQMRDYYEMVFGRAPTLAPTLLAALFALLAASRDHLYASAGLWLLAAVAFIVYIKESR